MNSAQEIPFNFKFCNKKPQFTRAEIRDAKKVFGNLRKEFNERFNDTYDFVRDPEYEDKLTIIPSTCNCERSFSTMKFINNKWRTRLKHERLRSCLRIGVYSGSLDEIIKLILKQPQKKRIPIFSNFGKHSCHH